MRGHLCKGEAVHFADLLFFVTLPCESEIVYKQKLPDSNQTFRVLRWPALYGGMAMKSERNKHFPCQLKACKLQPRSARRRLRLARALAAENGVLERGVETEARELGNTARKVCQKCMTKVVSSKGNICNRKWTLLCALYTYFMLKYLNLKEGSARK